MENNEIKIVDAREHPRGLDAAALYVHGKWGRPENLAFYRDAIEHSGGILPQFFLLMAGESVIGCGALLTNDFVSRHDLWPWYGCHFVEPDWRGRGLGSLLLSHATALAARLGFHAVYLSTDHDGYYEKYGWERMEDGFEPSGAKTRIYLYRIGLEI